MNKLYYSLGLSIAVANRFRRMITGYANPRPIKNEKIRENIKYDFAVIENFQKKLSEYFGGEYSFNGKSILEIGPGPDLGTGIILKAMGAGDYTAVDRFKLISINKDFFTALLEFLKNNGYNASGLNDLAGDLIKHDGKNDIKLPDFSYININAESMDEKLDKKFDLIISQAVLEHMENPRKVFENMRYLLKDGGIICHEIDLKTHSAFIRDWDPLNILRFSDRIYSLIKFKGSPNRLRLSDYLSIAAEERFTDISTINLTVMDDEYVGNILPGLNDRFKKYAKEDLKITSAMLLAKK